MPLEAVHSLSQMCRLRGRFFLLRVWEISTSRDRFIRIFFQHFLRRKWINPLHKVTDKSCIQSEEVFIVQQSSFVRSSAKIVNKIQAASQNRCLWQSLLMGWVRIGMMNLQPKVMLNKPYNGGNRRIIPVFTGPHRKGWSPGHGS